MAIRIDGAIADARNRADAALLDRLASDGGLSLRDLVEGLMSYNGFLHREQFDRLARRIVEGAMDAGLVAQSSDVFASRGKVTDAIVKNLGITKYHYLDHEAKQEFPEHILCSETTNIHQSTILPPGVSRRLSNDMCPAFKCYVANDAKLFAAPTMFALLDARRHIYYKMATMRPPTSAILETPNIHVKRPLVLVQDIFNGYNFAHFLFDWIVRIGIFVRSGILPARECVFVLGGLPNEFHEVVIRALAKTCEMTDENFFFPTSGVIIRSPQIAFFSDNIQAVAHPAQMFRSEAVEVIRSLARSINIDRPLSRRRLYISRGDARRRGVANESELMPLLQDYGFDIVKLADLTVPEQIALVGSSEYVVGAHGMGLTHLAFNEHSPGVTELFNPMIGTDAYAFMCKGLSLPYSAVLGDAQRDTNFVVDPKILADHLNEHLDKRASYSERRIAAQWSLKTMPAGWRPGLQTVPARVSSDQSPPAAGEVVIRHDRDGTQQTSDSNVGYWQFGDIDKKSQYVFSLYVFVPEADAIQSVSLHVAEFFVSCSADLQIRDQWQLLKLSISTRESVKCVNLVLRVESRNPVTIYSSKWEISQVASGF